MAKAGKASKVSKVGKAGSKVRKAEKAKGSTAPKAKKVKSGKKGPQADHLPPMQPAKSMRKKDITEGISPVGNPEILNKQGSSTRKVLVIYTGGTLGMQEKSDGTLGPVAGALTRNLRKLDELHQSHMPHCCFLEMSPILDSADMAPQDWTSIANVIHKWYFDFDGFVVLHGTDTMAYTASALSFMLEQLAKPVILTGAQLPIFEPISDARQNFLGAVVFAGLADISEVCLFFNGQLFRGNRSVKASSSSLGAFSSPSYPPLAEVGCPHQIYRRRLQQPPHGRFRLQEIQVTDILVVWVIPGFSDQFFNDLICGKKLRGMVLLLYGCGNAPARKLKFLSMLKQLNDSGTVVVACSQCSTGSVHLEKYAVGKAFEDAGVVGCRDMTTEAAVTKLSYLLSKGLSPVAIRMAMRENLRGELTTEATTLSISEPVTGLASAAAGL